MRLCTTARLCGSPVDDGGILIEMLSGEQVADLYLDQVDELLVVAISALFSATTMKDTPTVR